MGFHGKDDWESIQRRQEWKAQEPLREEITKLQKRIRTLEAKVRQWQQREGAASNAMISANARALAEEQMNASLQAELSKVEGWRKANEQAMMGYQRERDELEAEVARLRESEQRALQESRAAMEECAVAQARVRDLEAHLLRRDGLCWIHGDDCGMFPTP